MRVLCAVCRAHIYNYSGDVRGAFHPERFMPAFQGVPPPRAHAPLLCPRCRCPFYLARRSGSLVLMTDEGLVPPPTGVRFESPPAVEMSAELKNFDYVEEKRGGV